jgi:hypothetical protein
MIMIGLFLPLAAVLGYLIIAVYNLIPSAVSDAAGRRPNRAATTSLLSAAFADTDSPQWNDGTDAEAQCRMVPGGCQAQRRRSSPWPMPFLRCFESRSILTS